jgi:hypothetical protein
MAIINPAFATVADWCRISGMSRSGTYEALGRGDLHARKLGAKTLVDVARGLAWLGGLPSATIKPHGPQHSKLPA